MGFKRRERILIIAAAICVAVFFGDRLILTPLWNVWNDRSERIGELKKNVQNGEILLDRRMGLEEKWDAFRENAFPENSPEVENRILSRVHEWSNQSGINLHTMKPRWKEIDEESKKLELRLTADGSLEQVARFLYNLESDPIPARLEDAGVSSQNERGSRLDLNVTFSGLVIKESK